MSGIIPFVPERIPRLGLVSLFRNKAVAEGAVSFYLTNPVAARVARFTYGVRCSKTFDPSNHVVRCNRAYARPSGRLSLPDGFDTILAKV